MILSVDGRDVANKHDLLLALAAMQAGQRADMKIWRRGAEIVLHPVIGEMPVSPTTVMAQRPGERPGNRRDIGLGFKLGVLTEARRQLLGISPEIKGVVVLETSQDGILTDLGLRPGDVIETIDQQPVISPEGATANLEQIVASRDTNILMLIHRHGTNRFLASTLGAAL